MGRRIRRLMLGLLLGSFLAVDGDSGTKRKLILVTIA